MSTIQRITILLHVAVACFAVVHDVSAAPKLEATTERLVLSDGLNLRSTGRRFFSRRLLPSDDSISKAILSGSWTFPKLGDRGTSTDESSDSWEPVEANAEGVFERARGYLAMQVECEEDMVAVLEASGHSIAYINGVPHTGGLHLTYQRRGTSTPVPVALRKGSNDLVFRGRGMAFRAELVRPAQSLVLYNVDATLPDFIVGEEEPAWGAMLVLNATDQTVQGASLVVRAGAERMTTQLPSLPPRASRKVPFQIPAANADKSGKLEVRVQLFQAEGAEPVGEQRVTLNVREPGQTYKQTFRSRVDGSVQYYAVRPAAPLPQSSLVPGLVLSLHGAGVEAVNQANSYASKSWAHIVAPTNRRPYGYNWEYLGQLDAIEVLEDAQQRLQPDLAKTYLTGHSMGGHGTWHVGQTFPDRFAAIAPSAGWVTMGRYRSRGRQLAADPSPLELLMQRPANPNDTDRLLANSTNQAIYILHGTDDRSVPISHAQHMRDLLSEFHRDFTYYEEPDAGHWWDRAPAAGVDCVDWLPMFELFSRRTLPAEEAVRQVSFVTANPARSARCYWVTVEDQIRALDFSTVKLQCDPRRRVIFGDTDNVARLALRLSPLQPGEPVTVILDDQELKDLEWPASGVLRFQLRDARWSGAELPTPDQKGPHRYGPFRAAFDNNVLFVYGTQGSPEENAAIYNKVRYDCETYWVGGNGSVDVIADDEFDPAADADRNVVLYGNADTNSAWSTLLDGCPVDVHRGGVTIGTSNITSDSAACTFVYPRAGSDRALVGVVASTAPQGMSATFQLGYLGPRIDYPDCTVWDADGSPIVAGFFGSDWSLENGEFEWRED